MNLIYMPHKCAPQPIAVSTKASTIIKEYIQDVIKYPCFYRDIGLKFEAMNKCNNDMDVIRVLGRLINDLIIDTFQRTKSVSLVYDLLKCISLPQPPVVMYASIYACAERTKECKDDFNCLLYEWGLLGMMCYNTLQYLDVRSSLFALAQTVHKERKEVSIDLELIAILENKTI